MKSRFGKFLALLLMTAGLLSATGCLSDEPENTSSRPWDSVPGYQNGLLPSSINEGR